MPHPSTRRSALKTLAAGTSLGSVAGLGLAALTAEDRVAKSPSADRAPPRIGIIGLGNRGSLFLRELLRGELGRVTALCDIDPARAENAAERVRNAKAGDPSLYTRGSGDYRRLLDSPEVDCVLVTTPTDLHATMARAALAAGKWVFSEVPACHTIEEGWDLVEAAKASRARYFLAENYCFRPENLLVLNLVESGLFGELTFAECGYIHDCRPIAFEDDGSLTWRGRANSNPWLRGNSYPSHSLGPVSQWLGITRGDRFTRAVTLESRAAARHAYAVRRFAPESAAAKVSTWNGDSVVSLLQTESGVLITVRFDSASPRPHRMAMVALQGTRASYDDALGIYLEGRSGDEWEATAKYLESHGHPYWRAHEAAARASGHGGSDALTLRHFVEAYRRDRDPAIDVYDAVTWSALIELSRRSIQEGGSALDYPDFTRGEWKRRKRVAWGAT